MSKWMKNIKDSVKVSELNIPGTHDSGAYRIPFNIGETQDWDIKHQLKNGIRYLDISITNNDQKDDFEVIHGEVRLGSFNKMVMQVVNNFLESHPSETILISIRGNLDISRLESDYIFSRKNKFFRKKVTAATTLGDVRSKIVLFNRYNNKNFTFGIIWENIPNRQPYIQDSFQLDAKCKTFIGQEYCTFLFGLDYEKKAQLVRKHLQIAKFSNEERYFFNFASANYLGTFIASNAKVSNTAVKQFFDSNKGVQIGVIIPMDYPNRTPGVIKSLLYIYCP